MTAKFLPENQSHVFFTGGPVLALDWCPIHPEDRPRKLSDRSQDLYYDTEIRRTVSGYKQYLAVCPLPTVDHPPIAGVKASRPSPACIQIWSLSPEEGTSTGAMRCEMVLCIDSGPALDLKWCPLPSKTPVRTQQPSILSLSSYLINRPSPTDGLSLHWDIMQVGSPGGNVRRRHPVHIRCAIPVRSCRKRPKFRDSGLWCVTPSFQRFLCKFELIGVCSQ